MRLIWTRAPISLTPGVWWCGSFVGAKGGVEIGAEFNWLRRSGDAYADDFKRFARSLPGKADDWIVDQLPEEF